MFGQQEGTNGDDSPKIEEFGFDLFSTPEPGTSKGSADGDMERKKRLVSAKTKAEVGKSSTGSGGSEGAAEAAGGGSSSVHVTVELPLSAEGAEAEPVLSEEAQTRLGYMEGGTLFGDLSGHFGGPVPVPGTPRTTRYGGDLHR